MALAQRRSLPIAGTFGRRFVVKNGSTVFIGGLIALEKGTGFVVAATGAAGEIELGPAVPDRTALSSAGGITGNLAGGQFVGVQMQALILQDQSVAGLTAVTQEWEFVYEVDDELYTLTPHGKTPAGWIDRYLTGTRGDLFIMSTEARQTMAAQGGATKLVNLGTYSAVSATTQVATGIELQGKGKIVSVFGIVSQALVGAGGDIDVNLELGGVDITGGLIEFLTADARGDKKVGTAITALNTFENGALLDIELVQNTAVTDGMIQIFALVENSL